MQQWRDPHLMLGNDSIVNRKEFDKNKPNETGAYRILMGSVLLPQTEPIYSQTSVSVELVSGGILTNVAWPGPNVEASPAGIPSPVTLGIHGLYEGPLPGQSVAIGFMGGDSSQPMVIQKYPYGYSKFPVLDAAHILPMIQKTHFPTDVVLGHHTGSYIALRGLLPLPGEIDIQAMTVFRLTALGLANLSSIGPMSVLSSSTISLTAPAVFLGAPAAVEPVPKGLALVTQLEIDKAAMLLLQTAMRAWVPIPLDGAASLKSLLTPFLAAPMAAYPPTLSVKVFTI